MPVPDPAPRNDTGTKLSDVEGREFDYVVVGGGTAGLALAVRLSEDADKTVAVLEAGEWRSDPKIDLPVFMGQPFLDPQYDWCLKTTPQANGRVWDWPRGKVLGGSSALNFMVIQRGHAREYQDMASLMGDESWSFKGMLPYFQRSTTCTNPDTPAQKEHLSHFETDFHGTDGPLRVSFPRWFPKPQQLWCSALRKLGLTDTKDGLLGNTHGLWASAATACPDTGKRSYSASAYFAPNKERPNLKVLCGAHSTRIELSDDAEPRATGVHFTHDGGSYFVKAKREVLLSGGAIHSPQLLELSGIGRRDVLEKAGVKVRVESNYVGENLQEHLYVGSAFALKRDAGFETWDKLRQEDFATKAMAQFQSDAIDKGIIASTISGFAYYNMETYLTPDEIATIKRQIADVDQTGWSEAAKEIYAMQVKRYEDDKTVPAMELILAPGFFSTACLPEDKTEYITMLSALQHPFSRGSIHITTDSPTKQPAIDPRYFSNAADLTLMAKALKWTEKVAATAPLADVIDHRKCPDPATTKTDEDYENFVKDFASTTYHHASTCSMSPRAKGGVVDAQLRVYGVKGLRVVDASIIPFQISSHIQSLVYAIAEKAADMIKADAK